MMKKPYFYFKKKNPELCFCYLNNNEFLLEKNCPKYVFTPKVELWIFSLLSYRKTTFPVNQNISVDKAVEPETNATLKNDNITAVSNTSTFSPIRIYNLKKKTKTKSHIASSHILLLKR